jgi:hypothetical protein
MKIIRAELKHQVMEVIQRLNDKTRITMYGNLLDGIINLAVYRLDFNPNNYLALSNRRRSFDIEVISEICGLVEIAFYSGLQPYSYHGALLREWTESASYKSKMRAKDESFKIESYVSSYKEKLSSVEQFGFSGLFDALLAISNARSIVISPRKVKSWSKTNGLRFRRSECRIELVQDYGNFTLGWDVDLNMKLIQKNIWGCMKFAKANKMEALSKVLFQIKNVKTAGLDARLGEYVVGCYEKPLVNIKRIDAAMDEMFVHIYSRRFSVEHECTQLFKTKDHFFNCHRQFDAGNHSLIIRGDLVDGFEDKSTYYSLFSVKSYADLIDELGKFFEQVSAA